MSIKILSAKELELELTNESILFVGHRAKDMPTPAPFPGSEMPCDICKLPVYCSTMSEHIWGRPGTKIRCLNCATAGYDPHRDRLVVTKKSHDAVMKKIKEQRK